MKSNKSFLHIWSSYATYYFGKVNLSLIIPILIATFGMTKGKLGAVASGFLLAYAVGQFVHGHVSERFNPFVYMGCGLMLSGLVNAFLGFAGGTFFLLFLGEVFDGFFQSMGWSSAVRSTSALYKSDNATTWLGTSYQIGNSIAWLVTGYVIQVFGWQWGFWCAAIIMFLRGATLLIKAPAVLVSDRKMLSQISHTLTFDVVMSGISLGLLNFVRYGVIIWIPTYLFQVYAMPIHKVGLNIFLIPIAGCLGTVAYNRFSRYIPREMLTTVYMILLTVVIVAFSFMALPSLIAATLLVLSGFFLYGPHVFLVSTVPGRNIEMLTTASSTGVIDGLGYVGAMLVGVVMPALINVSWTAAFVSWIFCCIAIMFIVLAVKARKENRNG